MQDSGNDLLGHTITTLATLEVDPANPQASQPAPIRETLNNEFNAGVFNGIGMLGSNGRLALMFAPMVVKPSILGQHNHPDEGKFVAILGDLYQGNHHDYYVKTQNPCPFERISNNVSCLAADAIHAAAHPKRTRVPIYLQWAPMPPRTPESPQLPLGRSSRSPSSSSSTF